MSADEAAEDVDAAITATYEEYDVGDVRLSMIADPDNEHAWIQSDYTVSIDP